MQLQHRVGKLLLGKAQRRIGKPGRGFAIERLQRLRKRRFAQQRNLRPFPHAKERIDIRRLKVRAAYLAAKAVQCRNVGALHAQRLFAQPLGIQAFQNARAHLRRSRARERHHQHALQRHALARERNDARGEHGRFAAARRRRNKQITISG